MLLQPLTPFVSHSGIMGTEENFETTLMGFCAHALEDIAGMYRVCLDNRLLIDSTEGGLAQSNLVWNCVMPFMQAYYVCVALTLKISALPTLCDCFTLLILPSGCCLTAALRNSKMCCSILCTVYFSLTEAASPWLCFTVALILSVSLALLRCCVCHADALQDSQQVRVHH